MAQEVDRDFAEFVETSLEIGIADTVDLNDKKLTDMQDEWESLLIAVQYGVSLYPKLTAKLCLALFPLFERAGATAIGIENYTRLLAATSLPAETQAQIADRLGVLYRTRGDSNKAILYHQQALSLTQSRQQKAKCHVHSALAYFDQHNYAAAQHHADIATQCMEQSDDRSLGSLQNIHGLIALHTGQYEQAITYFQQAISVWKKIGDKSYHGTTLNNLGLTRTKLGQYADALQIFEEALLIIEKTVNETERVRILLNTGVMFNRLGQFGKGLQAFEKADRKQFRTIPNPKLQAQLDTSIGYTLIQLARPEEAILSLDDALEKWTLLADKLNFANALGERGRAWIQLGEIEKGRAELDEAILQLAHFQDDVWGKQLLQEFQRERENAGQSAD